MPRGRVCACSGCPAHRGLCGMPTTNVRRCDRCGRRGFGNRFRPVPKDRFYSSHAWRTLRAKVLSAWVRENGWLCPGWRKPPHQVEPGALVLDHVIPRSRGGAALDRRNLSPLCRSCNSSKALAELRLPRPASA